MKALFNAFTFQAVRMYFFHNACAARLDEALAEQARSTVWHGRNVV